MNFSRQIVFVLLASATECLIADSAKAAASFSTVVIDPGHGGFDRGGIPGQRVAEKW
jgi:N-acetylmuramoyl-L-alanine amidase